MFTKGFLLSMVYIICHKHWTLFFEKRARTKICRDREYSNIPIFDFETSKEKITKNLVYN